MPKCKFCGKELDAKHSAFCSSQCRTMFFAGDRPRMVKPVEMCCKFNKAVDCFSDIECEYCGWNPKVAEERIKRFAL